MRPDAREFCSLIVRHLERTIEKTPPDCELSFVVNEYNYGYHSHMGKVETTMNYSASVFLINDAVRALYVIYAPDEPNNAAGKQRRYLVKTLDQEIGAGDYVVVPTTAGHNLTIGKVTDVDAEVDFDGVNAIPWVVQRIDFAVFNDTVKQEEIAIAKIKKADFDKRRRSLAESLMSSAKLKALPLANLFAKDEEEDEKKGWR